MGNIVITYDTLYDLLRREKNTLEIQEIEPNFFYDILQYMREKDHLFNSKSNDHSLFGFGEKKQLMLQIENIQKILRELYAVREKKIMLLARDVSLTNSQIVNKALLLEPEKKFFEEILCCLNKYREGVLGNILSLKEPLLNLNNTADGLADEILKDNINKRVSENFEVPKALNTTENPSENIRKLMFLTKVESFIGPDMNIYGPYEEGAEGILPSEIAEMMLRKGFANEIQEGSQEIL